MRYFKEDVDTFYKAGNNLFLLGNSARSEYAGETVYLHTQHGLPIGCFTMQGFERRNQESKRIFRTHYNKGMHKCCLRILQRLLEAFHCC